ncbi:GHMP family kinase ATP-binding protein [Ancylomarina longa]|uniref:mevalonate kinase n=1 Tax=Ancylomarina longa TaxID=2487017 RepID=A0A434AUA4_9BACT|nr:mevalonate kinase [Ancylomarina longa]RUT78002.1 mevalonate kinase [Ancylomarina longa]
MRNQSDLFYAKILLFGEYSVLLNSMGLSIPYTHFHGELSFISEDKYTDRDFARRSNLELTKFLKFLNSTAENFDSQLNMSSLKQDIQNGLYFESSIPESYGLGSSGALCAAIYNKYGRQSIQNNSQLENGEIIRLKTILSKLESGFHGRSSGLDPLNSFLKVPLLIYNQNKIEQVTLPGKKFGENSAIFLIDSEKTSNTAPLVQSFLDKCKTPQFSTLIKEELIPRNNNCIINLIAGKKRKFFENLADLSQFQLRYFTQMIPESFKDLWLEGLQTSKFWFKLCGSGGGGFLLGFTQNYSETKAFFKTSGHTIVTVYANEK